jgi:hypothetical protein
MAWNVLNPSPGSEELIAIHAALLPTGGRGRVVYFGDWSRFSGTTRTRMLDLETGDITSLTSDLPTTNLFCAGQALLADGRLLVAGGRIGNGANLPGDHPIHPTHEPGERACWILHPREGKWTPAQRLHFQPGSDSAGGGRWYPTLVTLGSGEVFAAAGHPAEDDVFEGRHNNHTPERYAPSQDQWVLLDGAAHRTAPAGVATDSYPHFHLTRDGTLLCDTLGLSPDVASVGPRAYRPYVGQWTGPDTLPVPHDYYNRGSSCTSVLLPLLPSDGYRPRVLVANGAHCYRMNAAASQAAWSEVPARIGSSSGIRRDHGHAVLLPTGRVALVGGVQDSRTASAAPAFQPEIYDPDIDWSSGTYLDDVLPDAIGHWLDLDEDPAERARGYHSTALLLPDGRVWTGGSTEDGDSPYETEERRLEVWQPPYPAGARPTISTSVTSVAYGGDIPTSVKLAQGATVQRVALLRCGSCTHGFDSDQRYVGLEFSGSANLTAKAPTDPDVAPPGFYMLWVVDSAGRPCERASFLRLCDQELDLLMERSTVSRHEVKAMGTPAYFLEAFYVKLIGFMPHELGDPLIEPQLELLWGDGSPVTGLGLGLHPVSFEDPALPPDIAQIATFAFDLVVLNESVFTNVPDTPEGLEVRVRATWGPHAVEHRLRLTLRPNPRMNDGPVEWLSEDLRVFQVREGQTMAGLTVGEQPLFFLANLLEQWNDEQWHDLPVESHPFLSLGDTMEESPLEIAPTVGGTPVYNFAIAKVRMVAPEQVPADDVRVFFRLFPTWTLGFEYDAETYPRTGDGASALPGIGVLGNEIRTIPCFAAIRGPDLIAAGDVAVNRRTLEGKGAAEVYAYFGCWLDFNHNDAVGAELRGDHPCLVAEIHYPQDPVSPGATPGSSDNLSQRNIAIVRAPNPASPATRVIDVTFTVTPSRFPPLPPSELPLVARKRARADELMIQWGNFPPDTFATIYWPDVNVDQIIAAAGTRLGPKVLTRVDAHTMRCRVGGVTYIPIPGNRSTDVPGLLTVELPPDIVKGQRYRLVGHQVDNVRHRVVGSVQLEVPIATSEEIRPAEERKLAVLRWIRQKMAVGDRWIPIFERWLGDMAGRIRGMGGDPDAIEPLAPSGPSPGGPKRARAFTGKVRSLLYGCHGDFEGFRLEDCGRKRRFRSCDRGIERVVQRACDRGSTVTVFAHPADPARVLRIVVHCC